MQHRWCVATGLAGIGCNTKYCIVARQLGTLRTTGARVGALGSQEGGAQARRGRAWAGAGERTRGAHGRGARGAQHGSGTSAGRSAWARGLAKGCALGALSLFLARFYSVFFLSLIFGHFS